MKAKRTEPMGIAGCLVFAMIVIQVLDPDGRDATRPELVAAWAAVACFVGALVIRSAWRDVLFSVSAAIIAVPGLVHTWVPDVVAVALSFVLAALALRQAIQILRGRRSDTMASVS